jgi:hypothetical protein
VGRGARAVKAHPLYKHTWSKTTGKSHSKVLENRDLPFFRQLKYLFGYQIFKTLAIHTLTGFFSQFEYSE